MKKVLSLSLLIFPGFISAQNPVASFTYTVQEPPSTCVDFFNTSGPSVVTYHWSFNDPAGSQSTLENPAFCYADSGCYDVQLWVQDINGYTDSVTQNVCIHGKTTIFIPNAFSPNGDGKNDMFCVYGSFIPENKFSMWIFDYWGGLVFYSDSPYRCWSGKAMDSGLLVQEGVYRMEMIWYDENNKEHTYKGVIFNYPK